MKQLILLMFGGLCLLVYIVLWFYFNWGALIDLSWVLPWYGTAAGITGLVCETIAIASYYSQQDG